MMTTVAVQLSEVIDSLKTVLNSLTLSFLFVTMIFKYIDMLLLVYYFYEHYYVYV